MPTVFFSWQRDTSPKEGRNFLGRALERAIAFVAADVELEEAERELELDRNTLDGRSRAGTSPPSHRKHSRDVVATCSLPFSNSLIHPGV